MKKKSLKGRRFTWRSVLKTSSRSLLAVPAVSFYPVHPIRPRKKTIVAILRTAGVKNRQILEGTLADLYNLVPPRRSGLNSRPDSDDASSETTGSSEEEPNRSIQRPETSFADQRNPIGNPQPSVHQQVIGRVKSKQNKTRTRSESVSSDESDSEREDPESSEFEEDNSNFKRKKHRIRKRNQST